MGASGPHCAPGAGAGTCRVLTHCTEARGDGDGGTCYSGRLPVSARFRRGKVRETSMTCESGVDAGGDGGDDSSVGAGELDVLPLGDGPRAYELCCWGLRLRESVVDTADGARGGSFEAMIARMADCGRRGSWGRSTPTWGRSSGRRRSWRRWQPPGGPWCWEWSSFFAATARFSSDGRAGDLSDAELSARGGLV
jgi:hypothetical protein